MQHGLWENCETFQGQLKQADSVLLARHITKAEQLCVGTCIHREDENAGKISKKLNETFFFPEIPINCMDNYGCFD